MKKILTIKSELQQSNKFLKYLERKEFDVIVVDNGIVGIHKAQSELPDLIICGIMMPKLDGYGILKALRENPVTAIIPLIFVTDKESPADIRQAMEMGADDCITISCTEEEFLKAIAVRLERQAFLRQWYMTLIKEGKINC